MIQQYLYVGEVQPKGRGVFTRKKIDPGTVIEIAPVIVMTSEERKFLDKTMLHDYIFEWGEQKDFCCVALGLVSMYNHSYNSNCEYFMDFKQEIIEIKTVKEISKGDELTINYNGDSNDKKEVWFPATR